GARLAAAAAVGGIRLGVHAGVSAQRLPRPAARAGTGDAGDARRAGHAAAAAVAEIGAWIDARAGAGDRAGAAAGVGCAGVGGAAFVGRGRELGLFAARGEKQDQEGQRNPAVRHRKTSVSRSVSSSKRWVKPLARELPLPPAGAPGTAPAPPSAAGR